MVAESSEYQHRFLRNLKLEKISEEIPRKTRCCIFHVEKLSVMSFVPGS